MSKLRVTTNIAEQAQRGCNHNGRHDGEAIQTVCQVDRIATADYHQIGQQHVPAAQWNHDFLEERHDQRGFLRYRRSEK